MYNVAFNKIFTSFIKKCFINPTTYISISKNYTIFASSAIALHYFFAIISAYSDRVRIYDIQSEIRTNSDYKTSIMLS